MGTKCIIVQLEIDLLKNLDVCHDSEVLKVCLC